MDMLRLRNILETMPELEKTLLRTRERYQDSILWIRAKMEGRAIAYDNLDIKRTPYCNTKMEEYMDRITSLEKQIKSIDDSLKEIDMVRDGILNLSPSDQALINTHYIEKQSFNKMEKKFFYGATTLFNRTSNALKNLLFIINEQTEQIE